jgi:hypothetical protein
MRCSACGADNAGDAARCGRCGERLARRSRRRYDTAEIDDPAINPTPDPNPTAGFAYRFAVLGLIPVLGLILGPMALACGIQGLRYDRANPTIKGYARSLLGILLGGLELVSNLVGLSLIWIGLHGTR